MLIPLHRKPVTNFAQSRTIIVPNLNGDGYLFAQSRHALMKVKYPGIEVPRQVDDRTVLRWARDSPPAHLILYSQFYQ